MFKNLSKVQRNFDRKFKAVSNNIDEAFIEVGERGVEYLKRETPVDSGRLRQSMSYTTDNKIYTPLGRNEDNVDRSNEKETVQIGTNTIYGPSVEYRSTNGSEGFFLRSYVKTKTAAKLIFASAIKRGTKK